MMTPVTTGMRVTYVSQASLFKVIRYAKTAVKNGVVAPIAWLNETGKKRREMLPLTTEAQKTRLRAEIFMNWTRDRMVCMGTIFIQAMAT